MSLDSRHRDCSRADCPSLSTQDCRLTLSKQCMRASRQSTPMTSLRRSHLHLLVAFVFFCLLTPTPVLSQTSQNNTEEGSIVNEREDTYVYTSPGSFNYLDCRRRMDNGKQTSYICHDNPDMLPLLLYAERLGKETCEETFQNNLWNCSGFSLLKEPKVTQRGVYKESTYVHALSFAVIAHTVASACTDGLLEACNCAENPTQSSPEGKTCETNVAIGLRVAEEFLGYRYHGIGTNLKIEMIKHNTLAIKNVIEDLMSGTDQQCKCHGVSGSCTFKTCHSELPNFNEVAQKIKQKYDDACLVESNGHSVNTWVAKEEKCSGFTDSDLLYRINDPKAWCQINPRIGAVGVKGRVCNPHSTGPDSCENICRQCDRQAITRTVSHTIESECKFEFCCEIRCNRLETTRTEHVCS